MLLLLTQPSHAMRATAQAAVNIKIKWGNIYDTRRHTQIVSYLGITLVSPWQTYAAFSLKRDGGACPNA